MLAALVFYIVTVAPVLGLAQSGRQIAADRYTYLSMLPVAPLVAGALYRFGRGLNRRLRVAATAAVCIVLVAGGLLTWRQTAIWRSDASLWQHVLRHDPENFVARNQRGMLRERTGDQAGALEDYSASIEANPHYVPPYVNRGYLRHRMGDRSAAGEDYRRALELQPDNAAASLNLGNLLLESGRPAQAVAAYDHAIRLTPTSPLAYNNRGLAKLRLGDLQGARDDFGSAVELEPGRPEFWAQRGALRLQLGNFEKAEEDLRRALEVAPEGWAHRSEVEEMLAAVVGSKSSGVQSQGIDSDGIQGERR
jgi:tetratricopeptide (TPR) repeat protein